MEPPRDAVLGFRPHTYWTAVVALAGRVGAPQIVERRRIVFATGLERFVYHQAAELDLAAAQILIDQVRATTQANAAGKIAALVADLQLDGLAVRAAVAPAGTAKLPERLEDVLRTHAGLHAAEGNLYRDVVASACERLGLQVRRVVERDLPALLRDRLRLGEEALEERLKLMGAALGPPWNEDYRLAAEAAWLHLGAF